MVGFQKEMTIDQIILQQLSSSPVPLAGDILALQPKPLFVITQPRGVSEGVMADVLSAISHEVTIESHGRRIEPLARCVSLDRLPTFLEHGCDVIPTTAPMYVDCFEKALEYGGSSKVLMAFDPNHPDATFRIIKANTAHHEIEVLMHTYPNVARSDNGAELWLSRLAVDDPHRSSSYEYSHGRWIPRDPWDALLFIALLGRDASALGSIARQMVATCAPRRWQ